ncbi:hypothetical protein [Citrobacter braakii]|uniref:hypothetical protein n=1 Tax=Citrobacter braakii TaxID=57706 RepID=UPI001BCD10C1|nr:hypothetical protein [Citrobacter braakii]
MTTVSIYVKATDATIKPEDYRRVCLDADGIELEDMLDDVGENEAVFKHLSNNNPESFVDKTMLHDFLDNFDSSYIAEYLEKLGWSLKNDSDD